MSLHWPILKRLLANPRREVITDDLRTYRAYEIVVAAAHVANALERTCKTDKVGVMTPTSAAFPICALAAWSLGKTIVPLNYLLKPDELQYVVDHCETDTILTVQKMLDFLDREPKVRNVLRLDDLNFKKLPRPYLPRRLPDDRLATILYTSGTTGRPKGVMLTHGNLIANHRQIIEWVNFGPGDVMLGVLPQFHAFGKTALTLMPLLAGAKIVYTARFVPQKIVQLFREHRPTLFVGIPSMFNALLSVKDAKPEDFASLRYAVSGAEPLPDAVAAAFKERFGITIAEGFGMTETAPVTNWCKNEDYKPHSVGRPLPGIHQRIVDINTGEDLPAGQEGELRIKGPNVTQGYYKMPEETKALFDDKGYLRTGDMAKTDEDGHVYITGRLKEMMIIGGENVFPREIEEVLVRHEKVAHAGVVGRQDPTRGEVPVAFVELAEGVSLDEEAAEALKRELITLCRENLAGYKAPREVRIVEALPRNPTGKIMRKELAAILKREAEETAAAA